jgi:hypothetical protein
MTTETATGVQPALLFMPDISGFTEFVNSTEITHAQSIIQEVLELIIESNQLNLEVGEIEGDAVFFYRLGAAPSINELLQQVQTMFTRFHQHLRLYDLERICPCAACSSAVNLKLKIVAHFGEVSGYSVKQHKKLFGRDVIVIHRLLKNKLEKKEYALLTDPLIESKDGLPVLPEWFHPEEATENYDVGEIRFKVSDLTWLKENLPPVSKPELKLSSKTKVAFTEEIVIDAPAEKVFGAIFDITQRPKWMDGVKRIEMVTKDHINRVGTLHRCIISEKNNPVMVTEYARIGNGMAELIVMDQKGTAGCHFKVSVEGENRSKLSIDLLVKRNPLLLAAFNLFMKSKMKKAFQRSLQNLNEYCKQPFPAKEIKEQLN